MSGKLVLNYIICIQLCFHSEEVEGISLCEWGPAFPLGRIYFSAQCPPCGYGKGYRGYSTPLLHSQRSCTNEIVMSVWKIAHNSFICTIAIPTVDIGKTH